LIVSSAGSVTENLPVSAPPMRMLSWMRPVTGLMSWIALS
jgi:hypothetical protein